MNACCLISASRWLHVVPIDECAVDTNIQLNFWELPSKHQYSFSCMSDKLVLVTGASGYVGAHVFHTLLQKSYRVRGTVRSQEKARQLREDFAKYQSQIEDLVIVQDIAKDGAFDDAVKGVDYIIHTASPFHFNIKDNRADMLDPAVKGTNSLLAAAKLQKQIKRVVITSSFASIQDLSKGDRPGYTYTEADWNPVTWQEACTSDIPIVVYCASKKFAELAAYKFLQEEKPDFDITTICEFCIYRS